MRVQIEKDGGRRQKKYSCIVCRPQSSGCIGCGKYPTELKRGGINFAEYICPECLQCRGCEKVLPLSQYDQGVHEQLKKHGHQQKKHPCVACRPKKKCEEKFPYCSSCCQQTTEVVEKMIDGSVWYRKKENCFGQLDVI